MDGSFVFIHALANWSGFLGWWSRGWVVAFSWERSCACDFGRTSWLVFLLDFHLGLFLLFLSLFRLGSVFQFPFSSLKLHAFETVEICLVHCLDGLLHDNIDLESNLFDHLLNPPRILLSKGLHAFHIPQIILLQKLQHWHVIIHHLYIRLSVFEDLFSIVDLISRECFGIHLELQ